MSGVTRCPKCATTFRISDAQLAARSGQARCGRCGHVFDARLAFVPDAGAPQPDTPRPMPSGEAPRSRPLRELSAARRERRGLWTVAAALALIALAAQLAFRFRSELALVWPAAKPALERVCAQLGCEVPLPRRAELMSIETSDLQADGANPGVMVLTATLRNRATFPQQFPSLELTLTDAQDQALARRVLYARDYLGRSVSGEGGFAGNSELPVRVFIEASALKPTGYRLYLFFP